MFSKEIIEKIMYTQSGIYEIRDLWKKEINNIDNEKLRSFWLSIHNRLLYDTQWEDWQLAQYKHILSLANKDAKDVCIITGFPTMSALAYGYFVDPNFSIVYKDLHTPNSQMIAWNTWGQNIIQEDFRSINFRSYDLIINTILADIGLVPANVLENYYFNPESFDLDLVHFAKIKQGQEYIWGWPYGGSRHTFPLLFEYPHPNWHNNDYLLNRWSKIFDIKDHIFVKLPLNKKNKLINYENIDIKQLQQNIRHQMTDILIVKGIKK